MTGPFQVMPALTDDEYEALRDDIATKGILVPIVYDQHDRVIDGHHRLAIADELGLDFETIPFVCREVANAQEARSLAYALNLHRRHLTREQKRELLTASITSDPGLSDRQHAERVGVDHKTAGSVRSDLESTGEIPQLDERTGADGKLRRAKVTTTSRTTETTKTEQHVDLATGEIHDRAWAAGLYPILDVAGAPDDEVVRVAEAVLSRPAGEREMRAENGAKWLAAYVRRGGPGNYEDPPALVAARDMESIGKTAVALARHRDEIREAWEQADGATRAMWAGSVRALLDAITEVHTYTSLPVSQLRSVQ